MAVLRPVTCATDPQGHASSERCPACDQPIPVELSEEVRGRIALREREREARAAESLKREIAAFEGRARAEIEAARRQAAADIEAARAEARNAAEAALQTRIAELEGAREAAALELRRLEEHQSAILATQVAAAREQLEKEKTAALQAEQARAFEEKQKLVGKISEMQRQLENKTAQDLGEGPEIDLYELLKAEFPEDRVMRVEKGAAGADVVHDIYLNGRQCGRIVYDSKNRSAWRNDYVTKLRADQIEAKADHAVLSSKVFPAGIRELHLQEGVLVTAPGRVLVIANLLRKHVIQTHSLRAGNEARAHKTEALYAFIMSERCSQLLGTIEGQADELVDLDRKEERVHQVTWKKRGEMIRNLQRAHGDLSFEIDRIIGVAGNKAAAEEES